MVNRGGLRGALHELRDTCMKNENSKNHDDYAANDAAETRDAS